MAETIPKNMKMPKKYWNIVNTQWILKDEDTKLLKAHYCWRNIFLLKRIFPNYHNLSIMRGKRWHTGENKYEHNFHYFLMNEKTSVIYDLVPIFVDDSPDVVKWCILHINANKYFRYHKVKFIDHIPDKNWKSYKRYLGPHNDNADITGSYFLPK